MRLWLFLEPSSLQPPNVFHNSESGGGLHAESIRFAAVMWNIFSDLIPGFTTPSSSVSNARLMSGQK